MVVFHCVCFVFCFFFCLLLQVCTSGREPAQGGKNRMHKPGEHHLLVSKNRVTPSDVSHTSALLILPHHRDSDQNRLPCLLFNHVRENRWQDAMAARVCFILTSFNSSQASCLFFIKCLHEYAYTVGTPAAGVTDLWHQSKKLQIHCQTVNVASLFACRGLD